MFNTRAMFYNAALLCLVLPLSAGCGKPAGPPPGASEDATAPTVDLGTETTPQQPSSHSTDSPAGAAAPQGEQGDKK